MIITTSPSITLAATNSSFTSNLVSGFIPALPEPRRGRRRSRCASEKRSPARRRPVSPSRVARRGSSRRRTIPRASSAWSSRSKSAPRFSVGDNFGQASDPGSDNRPRLLCSLERDEPERLTPARGHDHQRSLVDQGGNPLGLDPAAEPHTLAEIELGDQRLELGAPAVARNDHARRRVAPDNDGQRAQRQVETLVAYQAPEEQQRRWRKLEGARGET